MLILSKCDEYILKLNIEMSPRNTKPEMSYVQRRLRLAGVTSLCNKLRLRLWISFSVGLCLNCFLLSSDVVLDRELM